MTRSVSSGIANYSSIQTTINNDVKEWFVNHAKEKKIGIMDLVRDIILDYYEEHSGNIVRKHRIPPVTRP